MSFDIKIINYLERLAGLKAKINTRYYGSVEAITEKGEKVIVPDNNFEYLSESNSHSNNTGVK